MNQGDFIIANQKVVKALGKATEEVRAVGNAAQDAGTAMERLVMAVLPHVYSDN
jgi:hypothetical protein